MGLVIITNGSGRDSWGITLVGFEAVNEYLPIRRPRLSCGLKTVIRNLLFASASIG